MRLNETDFKENRVSPHGSLTQETLVSKLQLKIDHCLRRLRLSGGRRAGEFLAICGVFHEEVAPARRSRPLVFERGSGRGASASARTPPTLNDLHDRQKSCINLFGFHHFSQDSSPLARRGESHRLARISGPAVRATPLFDAGLGHPELAIEEVEGMPR
jgi:hypothetical protein